MTKTGSSAAKSMHDQLLDEWGMGIVSGKIGVGEHLPEPDVGDTSPSRTVTREVTRVLEAMGLVIVKRKSGARVNPRDMWNIFDPQIIDWRLRGPQRAETLHELSQLRAGVEPMAARLAATQATAHDWAALTQASIDMVAYSQQATSLEYLKADEQFHSTLLCSSGNSMFAALRKVIAAILQGRTKHELMPERANERALRLHGDVAAYIRQGDGTAAEEAMRQIVDESDTAIAQMTRQQSS